VHPRARLDRCGKTRPSPDLIPRPSRPWSVAIPAHTVIATSINFFWPKGQWILGL
jgi:hypothetical protein